MRKVAGFLGIVCSIFILSTCNSLLPDLPADNQAIDPNQQTTGAINPLYIYWNANQPCPPWNNVGAYKPTNYSGTTPSITVTSAADSGTGSLRNALAQAAAGATIGFAANLADSVIKLKTQLTISKKVVIDAVAAYGITIDGQSKVRLFNMNSNTDATFIGLRMIRGRAVGGGNTPGGAVSTGNACKLTIRYCTFERDTADIGGAVRAGYQTITLVEDCSFAYNDGLISHNGFSAGAISTNNSGDAVIRRCLFVRNTGEVGGAIYNLLQPITVEDCVFMDNYSKNGGACLFSDHGSNGGPDGKQGGHMTVRGCWMEDNTSDQEGGALMMWTDSLDTVIVDRCMLRNDSIAVAGMHGGAVRTRGILTISNSTFIGCVSKGQGGALWLDGDGPINIVNSTFYRNKVTDDQGGAMTLNVGTTCKGVNITNCTFAENFSQRACGLMWMGNPTLPVTFTNCIAVNNRAGTDHSQDQVGYQPKDGGGNIEYPTPSSGANKFAAGSLVKDPLIDSLSMSNSLLVLPLKSGSPAIGIALTAKAPATDERNVTRDQAPDAGACEFVASDNSLTSCRATSTGVIR